MRPMRNTPGYLLYNICDRKYKFETNAVCKIIGMFDV
jgi:hypothetical protein